MRVVHLAAQRAVRSSFVRCALTRLLAVSATTSGSGAAMAAEEHKGGGTIFRVVRREPGRVARDLPVFACTAEHAATLLDDDAESGAGRPRPSVERFDDGAFVIRDALSPAECDRIVATSEAMGYAEDAPVSLGRDVRRNENCVWIQDQAVNDRLFERTKRLLPESIAFREMEMAPLLGLNRRWRLYKYGPDDVFRLHTDGAWPGSGLDAETGAYVEDMYDEKALSWLTYLIYLTDDFDGGATTFLRKEARRRAEKRGGRLDDIDEARDFFSVKPSRGSVLCFFHGYHDLSPLHEGAVVTRGLKYVARTDVLYMFPPDRVW